MEDGEIPPDTDTTAALDELLTILMGTQITAAFDLPEGRTERMLATLEAFFTRLRGL